MVLCVLLKEKHKILGNFPMERNSAQGHGMKSDDKPFSVKFMGFFEENGKCCD